MICAVFSKGTEETRDELNHACSLFSRRLSSSLEFQTSSTHEHFIKVSTVEDPRTGNHPKSSGNRASCTSIPPQFRTSASTLRYNHLVIYARRMSGNDIVIKKGERWSHEGVDDVDSVEISDRHWWKEKEESAEVDEKENV